MQSALARAFAQTTPDGRIMNFSNDNKDKFT